MNQYRVENDQIHRFAATLGLDEEKLQAMMGLKLTEVNINEFGQLDDLKKSVHKAVAKSYFEAQEQTKLNPPKLNMRIDKILREFMLKGGFEIRLP